MKKQDKNKLRLWQDRLKTNEAAYDGETSRMDEREARRSSRRRQTATFRSRR